MVKTAEELKIKVNAARLLTREELNAHSERMPDVSYGSCWWLADVDELDSNYVAYAEGNSSDEDMFCPKDEPNTWLRVALDFECEGIEAGEEFIYRGYVFTALSTELAISNNFLGWAKYFDAETGYGVNAVIATMLMG